MPKYSAELQEKIAKEYGVSGYALRLPRLLWQIKTAKWHQMG